MSIVFALFSSASLHADIMLWYPTLGSNEAFYLIHFSVGTPEDSAHGSNMINFWQKKLQKVQEIQAHTHNAKPCFLLCCRQPPNPCCAPVPPLALLLPVLSRSSQLISQQQKPTCFEETPAPARSSPHDSPAVRSASLLAALFMHTIKTNSDGHIPHAPCPHQKNKEDMAHRVHEFGQTCIVAGCNWGVPGPQCAG